MFSAGGGMSNSSAASSGVGDGGSNGGYEYGGINIGSSGDVNWTMIASIAGIALIVYLLK